MGSPANIPFYGWLAYADAYIGRLSEEEFELHCADCAKSCHGITDFELGYCEHSTGYCNADICEEVAGLQGPVNRCQCEPGFMGPLCNMHPVEGTVSIYLDHSGTGVCGVCGGGDFWKGYTLDGLKNTCITFPPKQPLVFQGDDGTLVYRQVALTLNVTHFSVWVGTDLFNNDLCESENEEGRYVIDTFLRNVTEERVTLDYAVYLDKTNGFLGKVVDPAEVHCLKETDIDQSVCDSTDLMKVYSGGGIKASSLEKAWVHLQLKVTPITDPDAAIAAIASSTYDV